ncbi:pyrimidine 5'-nucleotidase [Sphingomonas sp. GlSt437]|uniref:pyrimidine 5'-nucleotidase n=1 Tax=Sphingomonas sp. GlSt437 TaxID=3389970 RepID=UPI003A8B71B7
MDARLAPIRNWIFDLDNTLYPASANLFAQIDERITDYIAQRLDLDRVAARKVQKNYFHTHGTTLFGMMADHSVDPHEFLGFVHDVEMDVLDHNAPLVAAIARLPGRKLVFTNGDAPYAMKVLARLGLAESFEAIHDIHAMTYVPKPSLSAYEGLLTRHGLDPRESLFAEDMARNLRPAKQLGMTTVWVDNGSEQVPNDDDRGFIDFTTTDIAAWLTAMMEKA